MAHIKAILYDLDGVLVAACEWHYIALNKALNEIAGDAISRTEHESTFNGLPTFAKMEILVKQGRVRPEDTQRIIDRKQKFTRETIVENARLDGEKIRLHEYTAYEGIATACVTNCSRETANLMLGKTGQLDFMQFLVCNEDSVNPKPHPEPYIRAMIRLRFDPDEYLIVEDSERGIQAANLTGANVWAVRGPDEVTVENLKGRMT